MVYVLGIPTHLAVGHGLFEIIISASYGTLSHAIKGNVDILIALVMHTALHRRSKLARFRLNILPVRKSGWLRAAAVDRRRHRQFTHS